MTVRKVEIERFSMTTSKPFETVVAVLLQKIFWPHPIVVPD
jgi:hypothetical protein